MKRKGKLEAGSQNDEVALTASIAEARATGCMDLL